MKILQISDSLKQRFGVTSFLYNYNSSIDRSKVNFDYLIIDAENEIVSKLTEFGCKIFYMPKLSLFNIYEFIRFIDQFFKKTNYDIIHSHFYQIDAICSNLAFKNGIKYYISHSHNTKYSENKIHSIRNFFLSVPIKFMSTHFCACSEKAGNFLFGRKVLSIRKKKLYIIPNSIDYKKFYFDENIRKTIRKQYGIKNELVFGSVGSLKKQKNHIFMIKVFKLIIKRFPNSKLVFIGDGALREKLKKICIKLKIENHVIFTGTVKDTWNYYNMLDCFLFPSLFEGFGLSLLEAEINGLPCICSDKVPSEPFISKRAYKLSLYNSKKKWADISIEQANIGRNFEKVDNYFDISYQAKMLTNFYKGLMS